MITQQTLVIFALVAVLGLVSVIAMDLILTAQEAEAAKSITGQCASTLKNSSAVFCHRR
jgi:hypothetical protein